MSKAEEFFKTIVVPTVDEYMSEPTNLRRGVLAAIVLHHTWDYWKCENPGSNLQLQGIRDEFRIIANVANAAKHRVLTRQQPLISTSDQIGRSPGLFHAPFGSGVFAEAVEVVVQLDDGTVRHLAPLIQSVLSMWKGIYP